MSVYEGMFLLDNAVVREDWKKAKGLVTEALAKHGGKALTARRWDERKLAYKIKGRPRATFLLCHFEIAGDHLPALRREMDLSEHVLRSLILRVDAVPEAEHELAQAENAADFVVPAPPPDDAAEPEQAESTDESGDEVMVPNLDDEGDDDAPPPPRRAKAEVVS